MAIEPKRGCGYRKVGGTYLVGPLTGDSCHRLPFPLGICPTCKSGIKQTRGWTWLDPSGVIGNPCGMVLGTTREGTREHCDYCMVCEPSKFLGEEVGLLWVGEKFYSETKDFIKEAVELGVSRRISAVPNDFVLGLHYVFLAHPEAFPGGEPPEYKDAEPGIFLLWKPERIEKIITQTMSKDKNLMATLTERDIAPVIVPDDDPDHNPEGK